VQAGQVQLLLGTQATTAQRHRSLVLATVAAVAVQVAQQAAAVTVAQV